MDTPMTKSTNWRKFKNLRNYYIQKKKLNKTEKKHHYNELRSSNGRKLVKQFHGVLDAFKSAYSLIEKDKTPNIHLVVDALDKLLVTFHGVDDEGNDFTYPSVIQDAPGDLPETKALRQEIRGSIDAKIMDNLELVHHEAALLCPPFK
eukprot:309448_1